MTRNLPNGRATDLSLNQDKFAKCFSSNETLPIVKKDFAEGQTLGIVATPTVFIGDEPVVGLQTADELNAAIAKQLQKPGLGTPPIIQTHVTTK